VARYDAAEEMLDTQIIMAAERLMKRLYVAGLFDVFGCRTVRH
jgi:hypothetical protein